MPNYRTRQKKQLKKKRVSKRLPRDPRKMLNWAGRGSDKDYEKLRSIAKKLLNKRPSYIDNDAAEKLLSVDKLLMIEQIQANEQHDVSAGAFLDAVNWLIDKVPYGSYAWPLKAGQTSINAMKGDGLNEVDEQYARLVGATYGPVEDRPFVLDHWKRQPQFDSSYVGVWDNPDGHRLISVRGTQGAADIGQDFLIGVTGTTENLIGNDLLQILAATPSETVVDLAAHSLGTTLALQAYLQSAQTYDSIHESYMYNPAYSPIVVGAADKFERDDSVRYFVNFNDPVSLRSLGHKAPSNVVYRSEGNLLSSHKLAQWQGSGVHTPQFHAPPETKLHAHKAVFGFENRTSAGQRVPIDEKLMGQYILGSSTVVKDDISTDLEPAGRAEEVPAFDFGDVEYDYEGL